MYVKLGYAITYDLPLMYFIMVYSVLPLWTVFPLLDRFNRFFSFILLAGLNLARSRLTFPCFRRFGRGTGEEEVQLLENSITLY